MATASWLIGPAPSTIPFPAPRSQTHHPQGRRELHPEASQGRAGSRGVAVRGRSPAPGRRAQRAYHDGAHCTAGTQNSPSQVLLKACGLERRCSPRFSQITRRLAFDLRCAVRRRCQATDIPLRPPPSDRTVLTGPPSRPKMLLSPHVWPAGCERAL